MGGKQMLRSGVATHDHSLEVDYSVCSAASTPAPTYGNDMPYSDTVRTSTLSAPKTLGNQLGRWAIHLDFPVIQISNFTGATRQTVYNWFGGTDVTNAYKDRVKSLLNILQTSRTVEEAMRKCSQVM